jgi:hypothetical protein
MYKSLILSRLTLLALCNVSLGEKVNTKTSSSSLVEVAGVQQQLTGIAVSQEGCIFVNFPIWGDNRSKGKDLRKPPYMIFKVITG